MSDGRLTRLAAVLFLLLAAPFAAAATPAADRDVADPAGGQDITDMAIDPSGQWMAAVVAFDAAKTGTPSLPIGGGGTSAGRHSDIYLCDYGAAHRPRSGAGCRPVNHSFPALSSVTPNAPQRVDATRLPDGNAAYAIAGPDGRISLWHHSSDQPQWAVSAQNDQRALAIAISSDERRIAVGVAPASPTAGGSLEVRDGVDGGKLIWSAPLLNAASATVRPTVIDQSRTGSVVAIGTTDDVLFANPDVNVAPTSLGALGQAGAVTDVALSGDGRWVVAGASNGIFLSEVVPGPRPNIPSNSSVFSRNPGGVTAVAMSLDGRYFAAASGSEIHFFQRTDAAGGADPVGKNTTHEAVTDLAYDARGELLVAIAGTRVYGYGPNSVEPIWSFDAASAAYGALDGPLRKVAVSDDAQRIVVAGKTKTMAYSAKVDVSVTLTSASGSTIIPTKTVELALTVRNSGSLSDNYSFIVTTPVGWQSASAGDLQLDPEDSGTIRFNVTAPVGQAPGQQAVSVQVRSAVAERLALARGQSPAPIASAAFNLTIPRSVVLNVSAPDDRILLRQGGEQTVAITLRNEGNADGVVNLSTRQELTRGASWDITFEGGDQVIVPASQTRTVNMLITAPSDAGSGDRNIITIRAREGETVEAMDSIIAYVDAQFGAELKTNQTTWEFYPGQTQTIRVNVTNIGNTEDTYNLTETVTPASVASDWRVTLESPQLTIQRGQTKTLLVTVKAVASDAREATLTLRTISQSSPDRTENSLTLNLLTVPRPPTDDDDDRLLPGPALAAVLALVLVVALSRRSKR